MTPLMAWVTVAHLEEGRNIAQKLLQAKLAACVQLLPGLESHYWWKDQIESSAEFLLVIKTSREQWEEVVTIVKQHHSYKVPEIVGWEPALVEECYAAWWRSLK
jgi:periplasmic divalent cation tolerance protein